MGYSFLQQLDDVILVENIMTTFLLEIVERRNPESTLGPNIQLNLNNPLNKQTSDSIYIPPSSLSLSLTEEQVKVV